MRKYISLGLLALMFSLFSSQAFAGKVQVCEDIKKDPAYKGLYGLCNAYWNAKNDNARASILANFEEKAGPGGPTMPGLEPEEVSCPCWDYDDLVQVVACSGYIASAVVLDNTGDQSGFDVLIIQTPSTLIQAFAGFTPVFPDEGSECTLANATIDGFPPYSATSEDEDDVCRLDLLDLYADLPTAADCEL